MDDLTTAARHELSGEHLDVNVDYGGPGWSITAAAGGMVRVGPKGLMLPPGTVIRAVDGGFRVEGPGYAG